MREVELHITDIQQFIQCRQRWYWQSPLRCHLQPAGTPPALFLGQGVHVALDKYYQTPKPRDSRYAAEVLKKWCIDRATKIQEYTGRLWHQERDMINDMYALGAVMLEHYHLWAEPLDEYLEVIETESRFCLDVPTPDNDPKFTDDIHLTFAGRMDGIVRDVRTGDLYLLEFKTTSRLTNARYVMRSLQSPAYAWAADRLYGDIKGVIYRFLVKKPPHQLKWLAKSGRFSVAMNQKTSYEWARRDIEQWAVANDLDPLEAAKEYRTFLLGLHSRGNEYFKEFIVPRTRYQMDNAIRAVYEYGKLMSNPDIPIFTHGGFHCSYCPFADPCSLMEQGMDYQGLLDAEYGTRTYWEASDGS